MMSKYSQVMLSEAFADVRERGMPIRKAARIHSVPESTLRLRLAHPSGLGVRRGGPTIFTRKQEEHLAQYCVNMAHLGYGFTRWQVIELAKSMGEVTGKNVPPTKHWFYGFLTRFPELQMLNPKKREKARDDAVTNSVLDCYFEALGNILDKYSIKNKAGHIWNVDETGISMDHNPPKILARSGSSPHVVTAGKSANTTLIAAGSALGETIPPYLIFKGQRLTKEMTAGGMNGCEYRVSPTGWSNSALFLDFFQNHFLHHVTVRPCILLYDGHSTHVTMELIEAAREENIHLFVLPPHSSHCLQPLDVSVFSAFKTCLSTEFHKHMHSHPHTVITVDNLSALISSAYRSALIVGNIMAGFRKTGIFPFNPSAPFVIQPSITKTAPPATEARKERTENRQVKLLFQEKSDEFGKQKEANTGKQKKRNTFVPPFGAAITEQNYYEQAKARHDVKAKSQCKKRTAVFTPPFAEDMPSTSTTHIIHANQDEPVKKIGRTTEQSGEGSDTVTSNRRGKGQYQNSKKGKSLMKKSVKPTETVNDIIIEEDEKCIVCGKWQPAALRLDVSIKFVSWGQCTKCLKWVHLSFCTDVQQLSDEDEFTCPLCSSEQ